MKVLLLRRLAPLDERPDPLELDEIAEPRPGPGEILVRVRACGVCHTELDEIEARTPPPRLPVVLGHQIVGVVAGRGPGAGRFAEGQRVGVAWIHSACGRCRYCRTKRENLCPAFRATGRDADGGYAEAMRVPEAFAYAIPDELGDIAAAPLLCAGAIGYRALRLSRLEDGGRLGLVGFGASGHLVLPLARHLYPRAKVHVFARSPAQRELARELGAAWTGEIAEAPPEPLDAAIDTTPVWSPVVAALGHLAPGGRLVVNAIRKEDTDKDALARLDYARHLWMEKELSSVANVTRDDVVATLRIAAAMRLEPTVQTYPLAEANRALRELKAGGGLGAKVLVVD